MRHALFSITPLAEKIPPWPTLGEALLSPASLGMLAAGHLSPLCAGSKAQRENGHFILCQPSESFARHMLRAVRRPSKPELCTVTGHAGKRRLRSSPTKVHTRQAEPLPFLVSPCPIPAPRDHLTPSFRGTLCRSRVQWPRHTADVMPFRAIAVCFACHQPGATREYRMAFSG